MDSKNTIHPTWDQLISDISSSKVSLFDLLTSIPNGDYWAHVNAERLFYAVSREPAILQRLLEELTARLLAEGGDSSDKSIEKNLLRRDGHRRFNKLVEVRSEVFENQSMLLSGNTFEECLAQYKSLISHVEKLWDDASKLYLSGNYPLAAFISVITIEEIGKLSNLARELIFYDLPRDSRTKKTVERSHRKKQFIAIMSGALINSRLDRVVGKDAIRKLLHKAESDELERIRQDCLYIDQRNGVVMLPSDVIEPKDARLLTVLSGEVMAEVLGHFPWEFDRMLDSVIEFERNIGMPETKVARN